MNQERYELIGLTLSKEHGTTMSKMFGVPCLKFGKKAFALFFKDEMVFKLGKEDVAYLMAEEYSKATIWDPSGQNKPMTGWLQVPGDYGDDWEGLTRHALEFVKATEELA